MCYHTFFTNHICKLFCLGNHELCVYYTGWISSNRLHLLLTEIISPNTKKDIFHFACVTMCWSKTGLQPFLFLFGESWDMSIPYRLNISKWTASSVNWNFTKKTLKYHISWFPQQKELQLCFLTSTWQHMKNGICLV